MSNQSASRLMTVACILAVIWIPSACSSSDRGTSGSYDSGSSATVRVGGNDGWWVDAPIRSSTEKRTEEKSSSESDKQ